MDYNSEMKISQDQWEICILLIAYLNRGHAFSDSVLLEALQDQLDSLEKPVQSSPTESVDFFNMPSQESISAPVPVEQQTPPPTVFPSSVPVSTETPSIVPSSMEPTVPTPQPTEVPPAVFPSVSSLQSCFLALSRSLVGEKKADVVWSRFTDHVLEKLPGTSLKDVIKGLRGLEVDVESLKKAVSKLLEETPALDHVDESSLQRLLVLLGDGGASEDEKSGIVALG